MTEAELRHYGIVGMKWGKKGSNISVGSIKKNKKSDQQDKIKKMSDDELRKKINRLQMEKQYSQLTASDISKGKAYAQKALKAATTVATVTSTGLTIYNNADKIRKIIEKTN